LIFSSDHLPLIKVPDTFVFSPDVHSQVHPAVSRLLEEAGEPASGYRVVHLLLQLLLATWENADYSGDGRKGHGSVLDIRGLDC
jgi:hypothetical protein